MSKYKKKTICVALTNRTNYSKLKTILIELSKYDDIDTHIVLSSSILLDRYGSGYKDIEKDGFEIDKKIDCALLNDSHEAMAKTIGLSVVEHATYYARRKPDLMLIVGDRYDMLAPVVAAGTIVDGVKIPPFSLVSGNPMNVKEGYYNKKSVNRKD